MFHFLATTKCKRQQIAILIISFFAYVAGIRNEGNNMLLQQQALLHQQLTAIENAANERPELTLKFRPSQVIDFTPADAALPQQFMPSLIKTHQYAEAIEYNNNKNVARKQDTPSSNRRYAIETAATYGDAGEKPFSFPNERQQIPQHLTDKPIYIYRDPFTNENYHYTPTEPNVKETTPPTTYTQNNYNNNDAHKQPNLHQQLQHYDNNHNQEYLVQSSMTVGNQQQQRQEINPLRPYMSLSADKDVYLKRPGFVYDETYNLPNSVIDKQKTQLNKLSYDSHDYPPPSYFQQQTSNFLPTPVPPTTPPPTKPPTASSPYQIFRPPSSTQSSIFVQHQPPQQQQYSQSLQSALPNYANSIDNYLLNKQQTSEFYRTDAPPLLLSQQSHAPYQYENSPPLLEYDFPQQSAPATDGHKQQYFSRRPPLNPNSAQIPYRHHDSARPPPGKPSYHNYYDYQVGEIPPQTQPSSQYFNYPYRGPPPPPQYPYQGVYRPPAPLPLQQSGLATLAQYAPQFTSLLLGGVGSGAGSSNNNGALGNLIGVLTGATTSAQATPSSTSSASSSRRPLNSQLVKALENIARNDDLQCVPKVLCQMIAGQTQRGQLPTFITSPSITNFLAGFPAASPALIYGRAALIGLSGGVKSCHQTYLKCPKDEYEIIDYLNNHRGGFFKFFNEPEEQQQTQHHDSTQQAATSSLFGILSALAGAPQTTTTTPRPTPKPQEPASDITGGIANFFTQLLSDYVGGAAVEYQRRFTRRPKRSLDGKINFKDQSAEEYSNTVKFQEESTEGEIGVLKFKNHDENENDVEQESEEDFHDEEDAEDTQLSLAFRDGERESGESTQSRVLHKSVGKGKNVILFPEVRKENLDAIDFDEGAKQKIKHFNDYNRQRKLKFPTDTDDRMYTEVSSEKIREGKFFNEDHNYGQQFTNYVQDSFKDYEKGNPQIKFIDSPEEEAQHLYTNFFEGHKALTVNMAFPGREPKILNHFYYDASYLQDYPYGPQHQEEGGITQNYKFVLPHDPERPSLPSFNIYNTYDNPLRTQNIPFSNKAVSSSAQVNHFLPTPSPLETDFAASNSIYSNQNFDRNQQEQVSTLKYPSADSSSASYFSNNSVRKPTQSTFNRYHSSLYTTRRPYKPNASAGSADSKNIYVTNSRGVTEYYITPDGRKIYL